MLDRVKAKKLCESCGADDWRGGDVTALLPGFDEEGKVRLAHGLEVLPFACEKCGYVRLYAVDILEAEHGDH
jgi:predicted nucleic-acid-binding Zn-ribbon protein